MEEEIRCPKCNWMPGPGDRWECSCGNVWNTFETSGKCPACGKSWTDTQCCQKRVGGCHEFSPLIDWYRHLDKELQKELEKILKFDPAVVE